MSDVNSVSISDQTNLRGRDRRGGMSSVLATLARVLAQRGDPGLLRGAFEEAVKRMISVRSVRLRDATSRWSIARETPVGESIALDVPGWAGRSGGVLEATFDPGGRVGEWDVQQLTTAANIGALLLEIERGRGALSRVDGTPVAVTRADGAAPLVGSTPAMKTLRTQIERVAATNFTVLLEGESGVGKELVARQIHELSARRGGPFVAVNCAALVETLLEAELFGIEDRTATGVRGRRGKFEHADGGTLFLDEVSDLSLSAQAKLLRAIQELAVERVGGNGVRRVDIRIVAATNRGLAGLVEQRLFRADLFYRLSGVDVRVPSLRERRPDIRELADHFLARHRQMRCLHLSDAASLALTSYDWPGNVRELRTAVEHGVVMATGPKVTLRDLPMPVRQGGAAFPASTPKWAPPKAEQYNLHEHETQLILQALDEMGGNITHAAKKLGISRRTMHRKIKELKLKSPSNTPDSPHPNGL